MQSIVTSSNRAASTLTTKRDANFAYNGEYIVLNGKAEVARIFRNAENTSWYDVNACGPVDFPIGFNKAEALATIAKREGIA